MEKIGFHGFMVLEWDFKEGNEDRDVISVISVISSLICNFYKIGMIQRNCTNKLGIAKRFTLLAAPGLIGIP